MSNQLDLFLSVEDQKALESVRALFGPDVPEVRARIISQSKSVQYGKVPKGPRQKTSRP